MAQALTITCQERTGTGSKAADKLRKQGLIPAVVYGHKEAAQSVAVTADDLNKVIKSHARVLELSMGGKAETVLIRELQWDHLGKDMLHVDFFRVSADEKVRVTVPVELRGAPKATGGGVLDQPLHTLHVECPAISIPDSIRVDITELQLGQPVHVKELKLPEGVVVLDDGEMVVVQLKLPGAEPVPTAGAEAGGVEPEVITAKKPKDEEGEE